MRFERFAALAAATLRLHRPWMNVSSHLGNASHPLLGGRCRSPPPEQPHIDHVE
jgi:hypothetical protein